jgi:hypothetical protein
LKKHDSTFRISCFYLLFFGIYFRTTCRNVPTEILLKRYWLGATFSCWIFYSELPRGTMWTSGRYEVNCHFDQSEFQQNVVVRRILKWTSMRWKVYFHAVQSEIHFFYKSEFPQEVILSACKKVNFYVVPSELPRSVQSELLF